MKVLMAAAAAGWLLAGAEARAQTTADAGAPAPAAAPTAAPTAAAPAKGDAKDYAQISIEDLLNKDITVVATKTRVDVAKAPVSVTVLTPEDIRRTGSLTIGELLRTVPGLDVLESFPDYISVSARGTSESFVNNMLVLIDGRRFETLLAGVPFLDEMPVRLEDVKRIEVVKGPVGAVYGTNALAGVISITTYGASEQPGTLAAVTAGNRNTLDVTLRHAASLGQGPWAYKFAGGFSYTNAWSTLDEGNTAPPIAMRKGSGILLVERRFADGGLFEAEGGFVMGDLASLTIVTNQTQYFTSPHFRTGYSRPDFHVQLTSSPQALELRERVPPVQPLIDRWSNSTNLAVDHTLRPFTSSTVTVGGNLRYQRSNSTNLGGTAHSQVVGGVFVQDQQELVKDRLSLFGAVGVSDHPEIPVQVDGNAALIATVVPNHTLRFSFGRAHRDPSFGENFINFRRKFGPADGFQEPNLELEPEIIKAWEAGYHGRADLGSARLQLFAEGFKERISDLIGIVTTNVGAGTVPDLPTVTVLQQFRNLETRDGKGFEVGGDVSGRGAHLAVQYAYQEFKNVATGATIVNDIPRHKFSSGLGLSRGALELDAWVHVVSDTQVEGYVLLNPRVGVKLGSWVLSAQGFNMLNDRHVETVNGRGIKGETIGRLITASVSYRGR